jgi:hypothetical protein
MRINEMSNYLGRWMGFSFLNYCLGCSTKRGGGGGGGM